MLNDTGVHDILSIVDWLDQHVESRLGQAGHQTEDDSELSMVLTRIIKLQEECGEVAQAIIGAMGQNPRKGVTHTLNDVNKEVADVIITACVLMATINYAGWDIQLKSRLEAILDRNASHAR
jgi:NTP pyrophosphatase (non-canonical NTP hydrolase)